ncbi:transposase [Brucella endophytica]|uniref:Transposase n=2 Tax=Brucella endophytica TaxID=1963359 RepID=A0A916SSA3_9HYPH|nr:transposase [Brucella endophytica]
MERDGKKDVQLDVLSDGYAGRLEVIEGPTGRRERSASQKAGIVAESLMPGVRVADVARKHGVTRWQVYDWRRKFGQKRAGLPDKPDPAPAFAALMVEQPAPAQPPARDARIEIVVGDVVIRTGPDADGDHLAQVIRAARMAQ